MRIMVSGCGEIGSGVVRQLAKYSSVEITAADIVLALPHRHRITTEDLTQQRIMVGYKHGRRVL